MRRLFRWWLSRLHRFDVGDGRGNTFFVRYDVMKTRWFSVYLHEFFRSDADRCLHDHPWPFATVILRGGYWEQMFPRWTTIVTSYPESIRDDAKIGATKMGLMDRKWRGPGYIGCYPAEHAHRIEIDPGKPRPWSLVFVGRKSRPWGFWTIYGWRKWEAGQPNPICEPEAKHAR